ncbi:MAG: hypothetical protein QXH96_01495 [Candidatus Geothermarchaeota archaeon]
MYSLEPYHYRFSIVKCKVGISEVLTRLHGKAILITEVPLDRIISIKQLTYVLHNYFDMMYIKKWIEKPELRLLALLLQKTQIKDVINELARSKDRAYLVVVEEGVNISEILSDICVKVDVPLDASTDVDFFETFTEFRLKLEKERK